MMDAAATALGKLSTAIGGITERFSEGSTGEKRLMLTGGALAAGVLGTGGALANGWRSAGVSCSL